MPAHDYRPPATSSAREITFWSRFNRAVALVLGVLAIAMLVGTVQELNESTVDWTFVLGAVVACLGFGIGGVAMWRMGRREDVEVLQPGDTAGMRDLDPLSPARGPVHVRLAEPADGEIVVAGDGLHLPAGVTSLGSVSRFLQKFEYRALGKPLELPCFVSWSQVAFWSYATSVTGSGVHTVEFEQGRYLMFSDEVIGDQVTVLLDAVRSVGAQRVEVRCLTNNTDVSSASTLN